MHQKLLGGDVERVLEYGGEIAAVQSHIAGQLADGQVLLEMTADIICRPLYIFGSGLPAPAALPPGRVDDPAQKAVQLSQQEEFMAAAAIS